jgi:Uma2 family endonuclease
VPDWVCEVVSPSNARYDLSVKQAFYARIGVPSLWLVDTRQETLQVNQLVGERWSIHGVWSDEASVRLPPFEAIELPLGALWTSMQPAPTDEPR